MTKIASLIVIFFMFVSVTFACDCADKKSLQAELAQTDIVITGKVIETKPLGDTKINVNEVLKGNVGEVLTATYFGDCSYNFKEGEDYLVFGWISTDEGSRKGKVSVTFCGEKTKLLAEANEEIQEIKKLINDK